MADLLFDAVERARPSDLFEELGPEAPTHLGSWTPRDLAAPLVLRGHDYLAGPGLVLPGTWSRLTERRRRALALRDFAWLTTTLRSGPPPGFFRIGWVAPTPEPQRVLDDEATSQIGDDGAQVVGFLPQPRRQFEFDRRGEDGSQLARGVGDAFPCFPASGHDGGEQVAPVQVPRAVTVK
ncbi:hypothetical protein K2224_18120 [Streptomyces sp. BHT-5-2]|uniref:hypothetical protein n=1 Tax=unclassified Streptomyces TaxID=2593676 RepID=UPI001C8E48B7|nr:hypothetical protein [Streptomyces sp. BHT-5-2]QZL04823.1 hypothetical protein K2224_18120 [Streptomyces sp. BHT-5-2]